MSLAKSAALLLSTDLRELARGLEEAWRAQEVIVANLDEAALHVDPGVFMTTRIELIREDVETTRDRLATALEALTGRGPR